MTTAEIEVELTEESRAHADRHHPPGDATSKGRGGGTVRRQRKLALAPNVEPGAETKAETGTADDQPLDLQQQEISRRISGNAIKVVNYWILEGQENRGEKVTKARQCLWGSVVRVGVRRGKEAIENVGEIQVEVAKDIIPHPNRCPALKALATRHPRVE